MDRKVRPPLHQYIRKLLYTDLNKSNTEKILRQIRKLDWDNPDVTSYIVKCLRNVWNLKYFNIRHERLRLNIFEFVKKYFLLQVRGLAVGGPGAVPRVAGGGHH